MADPKLTLRPSASIDSDTSSVTASYLEDTDEDEPPASPAKSVFRRGFNKIASLRRSPALPGEDSFASRALEAAKAFQAQEAAEQHARAQSSLSNYEKPLPPPPLIPSHWKSLLNFASPPDTPKASEIMSRSRTNSRASTMDSATSGHHYMAGANGSQSSFTSSQREGEDSGRDITTPRSTGPASVGPSPAQARQTGAAAPPTSSSTHLSGLMCNVHRTTGREPHARVGATTTILGDKLYVFGGRVLSRSSPALTNDLYELDLIRRHWTKLETSGQAPPPRYFHSVCSLGDTKLVCYGGMSPSENPAGQSVSSQSGSDSQPEVIVMSDIHIYDAPTKTWSAIPTTDTPQGRYAHCATILPSSATFSSVNAPLSALHHNPSSGNPNQGTLGVNIDGTGGAEMVIVGGQDSANHYIEQISVFNLRSLKWTSTAPLGKSCGAYRSVVAPVPNYIASKIGKSSPIPNQGNPNISPESKEAGSSMLIYSNYNFLDVKLELQIRSTDGGLTEKPMQGTYTPPGLRFPNGGVIDTNFVVSGTYLTSSKQEYALWALDLRTLTWSRIDAGGNVFSQGSWNRGVLWNRRNTFVILGNRKRSLVEDYNHRRLNFSNVCMVELEAFGLYDNPRKIAPMSGFISASSPLNAPSLLMTQGNKAGQWSAGGRPFSKAAEELGASALALRELADMDILAVGGERIPVNSRIIARRWGPYFIQLLREGVATQEGSDASTLRPGAPGTRFGASFEHNHNPRNSSITITPNFDTGLSSGNLSRQTTLNDDASEDTAVSENGNGPAASGAANVLKVPTAASLLPSSRPRTLYLPHTYLTLQSLLHYLYTSSLPHASSSLSTPQILCSLLQLARPYNIEGLVEAVVERLHVVLDSRNAAAVFNAAAMAAGGGRGVGGDNSTTPLGSFSAGNNAGLPGLQDGAEFASLTREQQGGLRINTAFGNLASGMRGRNRAISDTGTSTTDGEEDDPTSAVSASSIASSMATDSESEANSSQAGARSDGGGAGMRRRESRAEREVWSGDISCVIGLQKRGLRGLMEGRRLRERGSGVTPGMTLTGTGERGMAQGGAARVGLGIA